MFNLFFSTWGEGCFMSAQTGLLIVLYFLYNKKILAAGVFPVIYSIIAYLLVSGNTPEHLVVKLFSLNVPFLIMSKVSWTYSVGATCAYLKSMFWDKNCIENWPRSWCNAYSRAVLNWGFMVYKNRACHLRWAHANWYEKSDKNYSPQKV